MAWIVLEGLDRTGKSTVAEHYKKQGFEIIHMSAPDKKYSKPGYAGPSYADDLITLLLANTGRDVVWDRSWYGELVWSQVYGRSPQLSDDDIEAIREIEAQNSAQPILMHDSDVGAHWKRCVENKEPLTRPQFDHARLLYSRLAHTYGFTIMSLTQFLELSRDKQPATTTPDTAISVAAASNNNPNPAAQVAPVATATPTTPKLTPEQERLEKANAIHSILRSKRIFKQTGGPFDDLEESVRGFLNSRLGELLGTTSGDNLSREDIVIVKEFVRRLKEKQGAK